LQYLFYFLCEVRTHTDAELLEQACAQLEMHNAQESKRVDDIFLERNKLDEQNKILEEKIKIAHQKIREQIEKLVNP
jgi:hypothetical protein